MRRLAPLLLLSLLSACADGPPQGRTPYQPSPAMTLVLQERQNMHAGERPTFRSIKRVTCPA